MGTYWFEIQQNSPSAWVWTLVDGAGKTVCTARDAFATQDECLNDVRDMQRLIVADLRRPVPAQWQAADR